jgi:hypothetical protein
LRNAALSPALVANRRHVVAAAAAAVVEGRWRRWLTVIVVSHAQIPFDNDVYLYRTQDFRVRRTHSFPFCFCYIIIVHLLFYDRVPVLLLSTSSIHCERVRFAVQSRNRIDHLFDFFFFP